MLTLIVGGSASGKSAFAENYAMEAGENRIYIATMQPMDNECLARIEKHRGMRAQKNFQTVECYTGLLITEFQFFQDIADVLSILLALAFDKFIILKQSDNILFQALSVFAFHKFVVLFLQLFVLCKLYND